MLTLYKQIIIMSPDRQTGMAAMTLYSEDGYFMLLDRYVVSFDQNLLWLSVDSASNRNEYKESSWG
jgi:hypothetical protein